MTQPSCHLHLNSVHFAKLCDTTGADIWHIIRQSFLMQRCTVDLNLLPPDCYSALLTIVLDICFFKFLSALFKYWRHRRQTRTERVLGNLSRILSSWQWNSVRLSAKLFFHANRFCGVGNCNILSFFSFVLRNRAVKRLSYRSWFEQGQRMWRHNRAMRSYRSCVGRIQIRWRHYDVQSWLD